MLNRKEIGCSTAMFLSYLGIEPEERSRSSIGPELDEFFAWSFDRVLDGYKVHIQAVSGEGDPAIWNRVYNESKLRSVLEKGGTLDHMLGPVICVEKGINGIVECWKDFPENARVHLTRLREPYHFYFSTATRDKTFQFRLRGEFYHSPLADRRKAYSILLGESASPPTPKNIAAQLFCMGLDRHYEILTFGTDPADLETIEARMIEQKDLKKLYETTSCKMDWELLTAQEILLLPRR